MNTSETKSVVCLVVDRLRASALGAYGNTWSETPEMDRLAAESFLLDTALVDCPTIEAFYRGAWQGQHALQESDPPGPGFPAQCRDRGMRTVLVTDEPLVAEHPLTDAFDQTLFLPPPSEIAVANAASIEDTQIAQLMAVAMDQLDHLTSRGDDPFCLWIHSRGMAGPWDAPLALRERLLDEDDPTPMTGSEVPHERLPPDVDPDVVFSANCAYAGQVAALDTCLGLLAESLRDAPVGHQTLFTLMGARGMPLGEHGLLGPVADRLFGETLHVPWLIRLPSGTGATQRSDALVGPGDMAATLADWLGDQLDRSNFTSHSLLPLLRDDVQSLHDRLCMAIDGERAIRTPGWFLRMPENALPELYVKPDDRWEMNEVANRCEPVVEELVAAWDQFATICRSGEDRQPSPLSSVAESGFE